MNSLSQNNNTFVPHAMNYFSNTTNDNLFYLNNNDEQLRHNYREPQTGFRNQGRNITNVWTKGSFHNRKVSTHDLNLNIKASKMSWTNQNNNNGSTNNNNTFDEREEDEEMVEQEKPVEVKRIPSSPTTPDSEIPSPSHHARRPMNAFLIFCKKHRPVVRKKYPNLENRGVTRILGEWWALLDISDKDPYKNLAKEYKDAFFSANPDFKWYKLPAPPLRTLSTRPASAQREQSSLPSPIHSTQYESEFTPGKLADESQLGMLSSLFKVNNYSTTTNDCEYKNAVATQEINVCNNNNSDNRDKLVPLLESPPNITKTTSLPPKPLKKRIFIEHSVDNKDISCSKVFNTHKSNADISSTYYIPEDISNVKEILETDTNAMDLNNVTKQELVNKVVDSMFPDKNQNITVPKNGSEKETRKSGRSCKGKLYAEFMVNGKLIKNKRDKIVEINKQIETELTNKIEATPKLDLGQTIKRLAERTHVNLDEVINENSDKKDETLIRTSSVSETSNDSFAKNVSNKFNLELRIAELPSLNYDTYVQRKRESKKRKFTKTKSSESKFKLQSTDGVGSNKSMIGSRKRKNKQNITHLETNDSQFESGFNDLSGLATLAEIAANTEKINQA